MRGFAFCEVSLDDFAFCEYSFVETDRRQRRLMHVIARPIIRMFCGQHPDARDWLEAWWKTATKARWTSLHDVRTTYASADQAGKCLVFDARGNRYRLIVRVSYRNQYSRGTLLVKEFLTHAEYDEGRWKRGCR